MRLWAIFAMLGAACGLLIAEDSARSKNGQQDWPVYGGAYGGAGQTRYSSLKQINRSNVAKLKVAWTYATNDGLNASQTHPLVVNGVLYSLTAVNVPGLPTWLAPVPMPLY